MKLSIIFFLLVVLSSRLYSQSTMNNVLHDIETNSVTLQALKQQVEAQKLGNRTGIYLDNPEAEFGYLWGSPASEGIRKDFSITQSFDFPTAYAHRSNIAEGHNRIAGYEYERQRKELLLQAGTVCVNLIYCNTLKSELDKRLQHAQSIATAYVERFSRGDVDILERNKAQLNLLNARKSAEANEIERAALLSELQRLNGGKAVVFEDTAYPEYNIPVDFEQWYAQAQEYNPALRMLAQETDVSRRQERLSRSLSLPKFSAGYMSESILGTTLQGVTVGVSIPLWENKNTVKQAKAQTMAWQNMEADAKMQFYNSLKTQYAKAFGLQNLAADYRDALQTTSNADLLKKALDLGQLSLIEYIMELTIYYDAADNVLQAERDAWFSILELKQWEE